jgi:hypothetical protein
MGAETLDKKPVQNVNQSAPALEQRYMHPYDSFAEKHYRVSD